MTHTVVRFDPCAGYDHLRRNALAEGPVGGLRDALPTTDVYTTSNNRLIVESHLPCFDETDITINIEEGFLVIQADRSEREGDEAKKYVIRESSSSLQRRIELPEKAKKYQITAAFKDGVLSVTIPLRNLEAPTSIPIDSVQAGD